MIKVYLLWFIEKAKIIPKGVNKLNLEKDSL